MSARSGQATDGTRMSALWGTGGKRGSDSRSNSTFGGRGRGVMLVLTAFIALLLPWAASAR